MQSIEMSIIVSESGVTELVKLMFIFFKNGIIFTQITPNNRNPAKFIIH
jgi:hypothetical protein